MAKSILKRSTEVDLPPGGNHWKDDVTHKLKEYASFLSRALEADSGPYVLCVDAQWGLGKTFFVRRWAKSLRDNEHKAVAEFNAWQHDCSEDPLLPFLASINEQFQECFENKNIAGNISTYLHSAHYAVMLNTSKPAKPLRKHAQLWRVFVLRGEYEI